MSRNMSYKHARSAQRRNAKELGNQVIITIMGIAFAIGVIVALVQRLRYHY
jgi:hypothetical protein